MIPLEVNPIQKLFYVSPSYSNANLCEHADPNDTFSEWLGLRSFPSGRMGGGAIYVEGGLLLLEDRLFQISQHACRLEKIDNYRLTPGGFRGTYRRIIQISGMPPRYELPSALQTSLDSRGYQLSDLENPYAKYLAHILG